MKTLYTVLAGVLATVLMVEAQQDTIIYDDFSDNEQFIDLSKDLIWEPHDTIASAFKQMPVTDNNGITFNAIAITDTAAAYKKYNISGGLRESTCFDYRFPDTLSRSSDTIIVEFDAIWDDISSQNQYRIVGALLHEYPDTGIVFGAVDSVNREAPFGRPAYNFRILSWIDQGTNNYANIFYGGGHDTLGEFEMYNNEYWIPGFIAGPGGVSPEGATPYPEGPVVKWKDYGIVSKDNWCHYKLVFYEDSIQWYFRYTKDPVSAATKLCTFYTPAPKDTNTMITELNNYYGTSVSDMPPLYHYFDEFVGLRLFFNGNKSYIANVTVRSTQAITTGQQHQYSSGSGWQVYPNPAAEQFSISGCCKNERVTIYTITGKQVKSLVLRSSPATIDCSDWRSGMYIIQINNRTRKVMIW